MTLKAKDLTVIPVSCAQMVAMLAEKGIATTEDNPHLTEVAGSMGCVPSVRRVSVQQNKAKSATYLAIAGGTKGGDAWLPVDSDKAEDLKAAAECIIAGLEHFVTTLG